VPRFSIAPLGLTTEGSTKFKPKGWKRYLKKLQCTVLIKIKKLNNSYYSTKTNLNWLKTYWRKHKRRQHGSRALEIIVVPGDVRNFDSVEAMYQQQRVIVFFCNRGKSSGTSGSFCVGRRLLHLSALKRQKIMRDACWLHRHTHHYWETLGRNSLRQWTRVYTKIRVPFMDKSIQ